MSPPAPPPPPPPFALPWSKSKQAQLVRSASHGSSSSLTTLTSAPEKLGFSTDTESYNDVGPPNGQVVSRTHHGTNGGALWGFGKRWDSVSTLVSIDKGKDYLAGEDEPRERVNTYQRLKELREQMTKEKLHYYVIPSEDAHQSEYCSPSDRRREWISGFTGSAGTAVISPNNAYLFTDSRYWTQAKRELDENWQLMQVGAEGVQDWHQWIVERPRKSVIGVDSRMVSHETATTLMSALYARDSKITFPPRNLVDIIWKDRPLRPKDSVALHPMQYAGMESEKKLRDVRWYIKSRQITIPTSTPRTAPASKTTATPTMTPGKTPTTSARTPATKPAQTTQGQQQIIGVFIAQLSTIAWLLNLRGTDIPFNPVFHAYMLVTLDKAYLFIESVKLPGNVREYLHNLGISIREYGDVWNFLRKREWGEGRILISPNTPYAVSLMLQSSKYVLGSLFVDQLKSIKNGTEIAGFREAYLRDGAAMVRWLAWLDHKFRLGYQITEWEAAERLTDYRRQVDKFMGLAYENISASGPNAALPHYSPSRTTARPIDKTTPYLIDSGGQYLDGTCDTTRTIHFGNPTNDQCEAFTRVLQGHIAIDTAVFPSGTTGAQLDVLARRALWKDGLNYLHGTGHGFGSFLNVHEGPQSFGNNIPLEEGHVLTNEPGFYKEDEWGIRLESALVVRKVETKGKFGGDVWLGFERFTVVPIQTKMIKANLLSKEERDWVREHNLRCKRKLEPLLQGDARALKWLRRECLRGFASERQGAIGLTVEWD